jgi:hypothetical protein
MARPVGVGEPAKERRARRRRERQLDPKRRRAMTGSGSRFLNRAQIAAAVCLTALLFLGLALFDDYGVSWDEPVQRQYGEKLFRYVASGDRALFTDRHRYYGPVFEFALVGLEKGLGLADSREVYLMRHLATFLVFWVGVVFMCLLGRRIFGTWKAGLLAVLLLVLSPRIFAHGFYNSKDIPFMALFIVGAYTLLLVLERPGPGRAAVHGLVSALLVTVRVPGVFLAGLSLGLMLHTCLRLPPATNRKSAAGTLGIYVLSAAGLTVALWPTLWSSPFHNFVRVLEGMRNFPWEAPVLYLGERVWSTELPWHYIPVWMGLTNPVVVMPAFFAGTAAVLLRRADLCRRSRYAGVILAVWALVPVAYSMLSRSVLYDAWRHAFFVYPAVVLLAVCGFRWIWRLAGRMGPGRIRIAVRTAFVAAVALSLGETAGFMAAAHPHQNVYFNSLVGGIRGARGEFELDYWGLGYRQALEKVLDSDPSPAVRLYSVNEPGRYNALILEREKRRRLVYLPDRHRADYLLTNFRWETERMPAERMAFSVTVDGVPIIGVYRMGL